MGIEVGGVDKFLRIEFGRLYYFKWGGRKCKLEIKGKLGEYCGKRLFYKEERRE